MRLIQPAARERKPKGVDRFRHYMTEHGVLASECGVQEEPGVWTLKTKCALRSYCLWLHKGVDVLHFYAAWYKEAKEFGILPVDLPKLPTNAEFDDVAPPTLKATRNLTKAFAGSEPLKALQAISVEVAPIGVPRKIFDGEKALSSRDAFVFLPWQTRENELVIGVYVMTWDAVADWPEERFRLTIQGAPGGRASLYDPVSGRDIPVKILRQEAGRIELDIPVIETPRLLILKP